MNIKGKYQVHFFLFSIGFVIGPILYGKNNFKISDVYILVKRALEKLYLHPQWGQDTHDEPHETGAARTAARPFFVQKKTILEPIKIVPISDYYKFVFLHII